MTGFLSVRRTNTVVSTYKTRVPPYKNILIQQFDGNKSHIVGSYQAVIHMPSLSSHGQPVTSPMEVAIAAQAHMVPFQQVHNLLTAVALV